MDTGITKTVVVTDPAVRFAKFSVTSTVRGIRVDVESTALSSVPYSAYYDVYPDIPPEGSWDTWFDSLNESYTPYSIQEGEAPKVDKEYFVVTVRDFGEVERRIVEDYKVGFDWATQRVAEFRENNPYSQAKMSIGHAKEGIDYHMVNGLFGRQPAVL